jgi:hypothetical protein
VWSDTDPYDTTGAGVPAWVDENANVGTGNPTLPQSQITGLAVGRSGGTSGDIVVIAVTNTGTSPTSSGLYRRRYCASGCMKGWIQESVSGATNGLGGGANGEDNLYWPTGSNNIYVFDPPSGIYRSADEGVTWTKIVAPPPGSDGVYSGNMAGYSSGGTDTLYISTKTAVDVVPLANSCTLTGMTACTMPSVTGMSGTPYGGPIAVDQTSGTPTSGTVFIAQGSGTSTSQTGIWSGIPTAANSYAVSSLSTVNAASYTAQALKPTGMAVSGDLNLYVSNGGQGVAVGIPISYG